ncbi:MAG: hypothetical protein V2A79_19360 [Planctomycetota bacterium]
MAAGASPAEERTTGGDFDGDGDVDLADYGFFDDCMAGPAVPPHPPAVRCAGAGLAAVLPKNI